MLSLRDALRAARLEERAYKELTTQRFAVNTILRFPDYTPEVDSDGVIIELPLPGPFETSGRWFTTMVELVPEDPFNDALHWAEGCTVRPETDSQGRDEQWHGKVLQVRPEGLFLITSLFPPDQWPMQGTRVVVEAFNYCQSAIDLLSSLIADEEGESQCSHSDHHIALPIRPAELALPHSLSGRKGSRVYWGPAGTGKTFQLGKETVERISGQKRCIALCATNTGADEIFLSALSQGADSMPEGSLLRFGSVKNEDLRLGGPWDKHLIYQKKEKETKESAHAITVEISDLRRLKGAFRTQKTDLEIELKIAELKAKRAQIWLEWQEWREKALTKAQLVAGTNYFGVKRHDQLERAGPWDALVLDEASLVSLIHLGLLGTLNFSEAVVAGDFMQHRPFSHFSKLRGAKGKEDAPHWTKAVPIQDIELIHQCYHRSVFDHLGVATISDWKKLEDGERFLFLNQQRRMDPALGDQVSRLFYENCLQSSEAQPDPQLSLLLPPGLYWFDPFLNEDGAAGPMDDEISQMIGALKRLIGPSKRCVLMTSKRPGSQQWTHALRLKHKDLEVASTNGSQGRNCDIALFHPSFWLYNSEQGDFADWQRRCWTVALSRARHAAVVLGSDVEARRMLGRQTVILSLREALGLKG